MLDSIASNKFQMSKLGHESINVKVSGMSNSILVPVDSVDELINMVQKAREEFYPEYRHREYLGKLFK